MAYFFSASSCGVGRKGLVCRCLCGARQGTKDVCPRVGSRFGFARLVPCQAGEPAAYFHPHGVVGLSRSVVTPITESGPDELLRNSRWFEQRTEVLADFSRSDLGQTVLFVDALLHLGVMHEVSPDGKRRGCGRCAGMLCEGCQQQVLGQKLGMCETRCKSAFRCVLPGLLLLTEFLQISLPKST